MMQVPYGVRSPHSRGFSLVEVLVAMLIIAGFLATAMQALIAATAIRIRSEEISEATSWIHDDLEAVRFEASRMGFIAHGNGDDAVKVPVVNQNDCAPNAGFADDLKALLEDDSVDYRRKKQSKESATSERRYILNRELAADVNTLKISHRVLNQQGETIGELYSEVIPDVSLACP